MTSPIESDTPAHRPIGVGVIGLGFMGATHIRAYQAADTAGFACRLVAVSDRSADRLRGTVSATGNLASGAGERGESLFDPARVRIYTDAAALLNDPAVELVSICTPTDSHVDLAIAALRAGKHVLVEKPVAIRSSEARRLAEVVRASDRLCMPGMCMRFWPGWDWLRERVRDEAYGQVLSATFQRLGSPPSWSPEFYGDLSRSGGPLFDLHIHDADFIRWCFGPPRGVVSTGTPAHITTIYRYEAGKGPAHVVAEGGQNHAPGFPFKMRYIVAFERATADWDLTRSPMLLLCRNGQAEPVQLPPGTAYEYQVRHMLEAIRLGRRNDELRATIEEAVEVTELLEAEQVGLGAWGLAARYELAAGNARAMRPG